MQFEDLHCHVLELIFEHLCLRDFLRVAATCHHFYKLILGILVLPAAPGAKKRKRTPVSQSKTALFKRAFERYAVVAREMFLETDAPTLRIRIIECYFPPNIVGNWDCSEFMHMSLGNAIVKKMNNLAGLDFLKCLFRIISTRCVRKYHKTFYQEMASSLRKVAHVFDCRVSREISIDHLACWKDAHRLLEIEAQAASLLVNEITAPGTCFPYKMVSVLTSRVMQSIDTPLYLSPTIPPNNAEYLIAQAKQERDEYLNCPI